MSIETQAFDMSEVGAIEPQGDSEVERRQAIIDQGVINFVGDLFANSQINLNESQIVLAREIIEPQLEDISELRRRAVIIRHGLDGDDPVLRFEELGKKMGITKNKAKQAYAGAKKQLRHPNRLGNLRETLGIPVPVAKISLSS